MSVRLISHPAVADRLARVRDAHTTSPDFRRLVEDIGIYLAYEATRDLPMRFETVETPVAPAQVQRIANVPVVAPILRAGLGLLTGFLHVTDNVTVAHLGLYRDPQTLEAVAYYANLPDDLRDRPTFVLDPMLATGHSSIAALDMLAARGARDVTLVAVIAAQPGVDAVLAAHPSVRIVCAAIDEQLNDHGYIVPGLGDAGDRLYGSVTSVPVSVRPT